MTEVIAEQPAQRRFQGVWIPADLWLDRSLSLVEKAMLAEISSLETNDKGCYASNKYFAEFFSLSPSRVSEIISSLSKKGHIGVTLIRRDKQIVRREIRTLAPVGNPNTPCPFPNTPPSENTQNPIRETDEGYSEKAQENNTKGSNKKSSKTNPSPNEPGRNLAPSTKRSEKRKTPLPVDFGVSERVMEWAAEKGYGRLEERLEHFVGSAKANGYHYVDWDAAFMNAVRDDWAKLAERPAPRADDATRGLVL
jgi:hypothetical protein